MGTFVGGTMIVDVPKSITVAVAGGMPGELKLVDVGGPKKANFGVDLLKTGFLAMLPASLINPTCAGRAILSSANPIYNGPKRS